MKKYLIIFILTATCLLIFVGCGSSENNQSTGQINWEPTKYKTVNNLEGVMMTVKEGSVSSTGLTVILENHSESQCIYGEQFWIEKKVNGDWYQVPVVLDGDYGVNAIGYDLSPGKETDWTVDWEWLYGELELGEYRIVKDILDFRSTGDYDTHYLSAEFIIEK